MTVYDFKLYSIDIDTGTIVRVRTFPHQIVDLDREGEAQLLFINNLLIAVTRINLYIYSISKVDFSSAPPTAFPAEYFNDVARFQEDIILNQ